MRPPILTKYRADELVTNLKDSKDAIVWVTRFIPQILNKQKIHANAISLVKRISLFKKQPINEDDIKKLQNHFKEIGRDDLACVRETDNRKKMNRAGTLQYIVSKNIFMESNSFFTDKTSYFSMSLEKSIDIDSKDDLNNASLQFQE